MATLTATLKLTAAAGQVSTSSLSISESDTLTVDPIPMQGVTRVALAASGGSAVELVPASAEAKFVYIKNTGLQSDGSTATTHVVEVSIGGNSVLRVHPGEFAFVPVVASSAVTAVGSSTHLILAEFAFFTRS